MHAVTSCGDAGGFPLMEHWDGNEWNVNPAPLEDDGEAALAVLTFPSRHVYVGRVCVSGPKGLFRSC